MNKREKKSGKKKTSKAAHTDFVILLSTAAQFWCWIFLSTSLQL